MIYLEMMIGIVNIVLYALLSFWLPRGQTSSCVMYFYYSELISWHRLREALSSLRFIAVKEDATSMIILQHASYCSTKWRETQGWFWSSKFTDILDTYRSHVEIYKTSTVKDTITKEYFWNNLSLEMLFLAIFHVILLNNPQIINWHKLEEQELLVLRRWTKGVWYL